MLMHKYVKYEFECNSAHYVHYIVEDMVYHMLISAYVMKSA